MHIKKYQSYSVLEAARERIKIIFDNFEKICISFSGGKDSTVMMHLMMEEAIKRDRKVGCLIIDLEAQYKDTIDHLMNMVKLYEEHIDLHWAALPMALRNAVSNYEPQWCCWDEDKKDAWVRQKPEFARE